MPSRAAGASARPSPPSISRTWAVTSALGSSITSPKSQNGMSRHDLPHVVGVERPPAAVLALHADGPFGAAADRLVNALGLRVADPTERQHDLGGVVDVRVVVVVELERPSARGELRPADRPVALDPYLLAKKPVGRFDERGVVARDARVAQCDHRQRRVPYGRLACLQAPHIALLDEEPLDAVEPLLHRPLADVVAAQGERHEGVDPGRLDPAPGPVVLLALEHPPLDPRQRPAPKRLQRMPLIDAADAVEPQEHAPAEGPGPRLDRAPGSQLVEAEGQWAHRALGADDRERGDRLPRPAGEVVDVEGEPGRQEDQLGGQRGDVVPLPEAEEREPDMGEDARVLDAPGGAGPTRARRPCGAPPARRPRA